MRRTSKAFASPAVPELVNVLRLDRLGILFVGLLALVRIAGAQSWLNVPAPKSPLLPFKPGTTALQLTDGSIMVQEFETANWWKLTPDDKADYNKGTWSRLESSKGYNAKGELEDYAPRLCASAVLPDGRVIVEGGEYEYGSGTEVKETNKGAIYNPFTGHWTAQQAPPGWTQIGDAPSIVLPDGTFMLGNINSKEVAFLGASTKWNWILVSPTGKYDSNSEEGWTLLPGGKVLTVDTYINAPGKGVPSATATLPDNSEVFDPSTETWASAGSTVAPLSNLSAICPLTKTGGYVTGGHEVGPAILRPDGTVFATGVYVCGKGEGGGGGAGHTAIYQELSLTGIPFWIAGPDIPCEGSGAKKVCNDMADAPAALLINGNVLVQTSPGSNQGNSTFYEFDLLTNAFFAGD